MKRTQYATAAFSVLTAVFFLTFVGLVFAAPGDLDPSFSEDGKLIDFLPGGGSDTLPHTARGIAIQPDGKIIVVGYRGNSSDSDFLIFRYMPDGLPDNSFDADGKVLISFSSGHDRAYAVALQSDGKIVVTGSSVNQINIDFAVVRLNPDGSLDTTFDGDGKVVTPFPDPSHDEATAVVLQPDGKIVAAGYSISTISPQCAVARYNTDGSLDTSFSKDGKANGPFVSRGDDVVLQSDGKIVVGGGPAFSVVRFNADGSWDSTFGGDGHVISQDGPSNAITIQPNGKIIAAGWSPLRFQQWFEDFGLVRYNTDGTLDRSFDWDGKLILPNNTSREEAHAVVAQPDGKIVAAGQSSLGGNTNFAIFRYKSNGLLDDEVPPFFEASFLRGFESLFGSGGLAFIDFGGTDVAYAMALDNLGRIVVVGESNQRFAIARLLGDPKPEPPILSISGQILTSAGRGIPKARVTITDTKNVSHTLITNAFGYYRFVDIPGGATRTISVSAKRYNFTASPQVVTLNEDLVLDFHAAQ